MDCLINLPSGLNANIQSDYIEHDNVYTRKVLVEKTIKRDIHVIIREMVIDTSVHELMLQWCNIVNDNKEV